MGKSSGGGRSTSRKLILNSEPPTTKSYGPNSKWECDTLREQRSRGKQYESTVGLGVVAARIGYYLQRA